MMTTDRTGIIGARGLTFTWPSAYQMRHVGEREMIDQETSLPWSSLQPKRPLPRSAIGWQFTPRRCHAAAARSGCSISHSYIAGEASNSSTGARVTSVGCVTVFLTFSRRAGGSVSSGTRRAAAAEVEVLVRNCGDSAARGPWARATAEQASATRQHRGMRGDSIGDPLRTVIPFGRPIIHRP